MVYLYSSDTSMKIYLSVLLAFLSFSISSQNLQLTDQAEVSLFTIEKGAELYDSFGHTAIRIKDPLRGIDAVYNYGGFDFNTPNFYLKFAQGKLPYTLGRDANYQRFLANYKAQNRKITEQVLQLDTQQKQEVFNYLENNYKPENRLYLYDFFYDNCATRPNEVFQSVLKNSLQMDYSHQPADQTHRDLIYQFVDINSWGSLGIDIALGAVIDRPASPKEYLFLPEYVQFAFAKARLKTPTGYQALVKQTNDIYTPVTPLDTSTPFLLSPLFILGLLSILILYKTYKDYKNKRKISTFDSFLFFILGLIGVLLILLWFATDHTATKWNYNLLWAFPLQLVAAFVIAKKNPPQWVYPYMKLQFILLVFLTFQWIVGIQAYALTLIPLLIALAMRYLFILKSLKDIRDSA